MTKTNNYNLKKPEPTDPLRVADFNENADLIDAALGALTGAYGPSNLPWEVGTLDLSKAEVTSLVKLFDFHPSAVFLFAKGTIGGGAVNPGSMRVYDISDTTDYHNFALWENELWLDDMQGMPFSSLCYVALK